MNSKSPAFNQSVLRYLVILALFCALAQVVVALQRGEINILTALALVPAYLYYLYFVISSKQLLRRVRFGQLTVHFATFLVVNLSYHIHAAVLLLGNAGSSQNSTTVLYEGWFGVLFGMFVLWGIGLLIHAITSIAHKGYEDLDI